MEYTRQYHLEAEKRYREKHRKEINERGKIRMRKLWKDNPELAKRKQRQYRQATRERTVLIYGGKCECCGETEIKFLTFEHKNGGGRKERMGLGSGFYATLRKSKRKDIGILCYNCNCSKGFYGKCPHKN